MTKKQAGKYISALDEWILLAPTGKEKTGDIAGFLILREPEVSTTIHEKTRVPGHFLLLALKQCWIYSKITELKRRCDFFFAENLSGNQKL